VEVNCLYNLFIIARSPAKSGTRKQSVSCRVENYMIDAHIHLEKGPYNLDWLQKFINTAIKRGISELYLLEHSHRFIEFKPLYQSVIKDESEVGRYQRNWFSRRLNKPLDEYQDFIRAMRKESFPVKVKFGLEICYFPEYEEQIKHIISDFDGDFLTGAIHWIDGWGFDHLPIKESWTGKDVNGIYKKYYELMEKLIQSDLFNHLAHPDSIKCFNYYPDYDLTETYSNVAKLLKNHNMKTEFSLGLYINYGHKEFRLNEEFLSILKQEKVELMTASDAHIPENVGIHIKKATEII
jgi:histidinol-phosphatase (PHP family)